MVDAPKFKCLTKVIEGHEIAGKIERSRKWMKAYRGQLIVFEDKLVFSDKTIAFSDVTSATLYEVQQSLLKVPLLEISTNDTTYQFGLNPWIDIAKHLPLKLKKGSAKLRPSVLSIARSSLLFFAILYLVWRMF